MGFPLTFDGGIVSPISPQIHKRHVKVYYRLLIGGHMFRINASIVLNLIRYEDNLTE